MPKGKRKENEKDAGEGGEKDDFLGNVPSVSLIGLFKYADRVDVVLMVLGSVGAIALGVAMPLFAILLGGVMDGFSSSNPDDISAAGKKYALLFGWIAVGAFFAASLQMGCFTVASERQILRIRRKFLDAILKQEIAFFDRGSGQLATAIAESTVVIREAIGEKLGLLFQFGSMFLSGFIIGFIKDWKLTLVVVSVTPLLAVAGFLVMKSMSDATSGGLGAYAKAGAIAEETLSRMRTVASFGLEQRLSLRYLKELTSAQVEGIRKAKVQGGGLGFTMAVYFLSYSLTFWVGAKLVLESKTQAAEAYPPSNQTNPLCEVGTLVTPEIAEQLYCYMPINVDSFTFGTPADVCNCMACMCGCTVSGDCLKGGDILLVFFAVVLAAFSLGQAAPSVNALNNGRAAASKIFSILDRVPEIDASGETGDKLESLEGFIQLEDVSFRYPTRKGVLVFHDLSLDIPSGRSTAIVGGSGCGKSTVTQLVQRFYDPEKGRVLLDGVDIRTLNLKWLREQMSLVSQEPILFATSIAENISYGAIEGQTVTREQIEAAARAANAFDFIMEFPNGFDTFVGEAGSSLSGGQKQRIAIARAMIRDPTILILDEATSALDNESEHTVQAALDKLLEEKSRTTIVIAHRLTTVRNCDKIVVLGDGHVLEQGTHEELLTIENGFYNALLAAAARTKEERATVPSSFQVMTTQSDKTLEDNTTPDSKPASFLGLGGEKNELTQMPEEVDKHDKALVEKTTEKEKVYSVPLRRIFVYSTPEKWLYLPASLASLVQGAVLPVFAILFSGIANTYFLPTEELIQDEVNAYALYFILLAAVVSLSMFFGFYLFGIIGEKMTTRVRYALFQALLRQDIGFFDQESHSVGALVSRLSTDAALVKASLADRLNMVVMNTSTVISALVIAFYYGWKLTLILIGLVPLMILSGALELLAVGGLAKKDDEALSEAGKVLTESIQGIRTVTAFALRSRVVRLYETFLVSANSVAIRKGVVVGLGFGFSQGVVFVIYAIAFQQGARLIADPNENYDLQRLLNVFFAVAMLGFGLGQSAALSQDVAKAKMAISHVFKLVDSQSKVDPFLKEGKTSEDETSSDIDFDHVTFAYPTRPDAKVFENFDLKIHGGMTVALVGQSGSGKSTAISLLERFYDPNEGQVSVHGIPIKQANVSWLRSSKYGYVQQEPHLFSGTVFENIAFGVSDAELETTNGLVPEARVVDAAKAANAHEFIMQLPEGYQTVISSSTLSGGQKQRIAIARCLIRDPEILLLDEATAALDNESEAVVQQALDDIIHNKHKTVVIVAHRLSTIKNADLICVVHHGQIIEAGTFHDLLADPNSAFSKLHSAQSGVE